jgi:UDP-glucose 4-epimerase
MLAVFECACGKKLGYQIMERRPGDIATCYADPAKANSELGWQAVKSVDDMVVDTWRWQQANPNGYN